MLHNLKLFQKNRLKFFKQKKNIFGKSSKVFNRNRLLKTHYLIKETIAFKWFELYKLYYIHTLNLHH